MNKSLRPRLLLNAEPFGFGPTAAIADFFPHLAAHCDKIGFIGRNHTLDLQRKLPYDAIHDTSGLSREDFLSKLKELRADYDYFVTACDFEAAEMAVQAGFKVCIYDPLTWYWKEIHPAAARCDLYLAQDFVGVKERLASEPEHFASPLVVSPIVPETAPFSGERDTVLLNLGGLSNPFWTNEHTSAYARVMVQSFLAAVAVAGGKPVIAGNASLANELAGFGVRNYSRSQMQSILEKARYAFMTPGLGNIYDAARYGTPTIWLPPANDSQGQQRDLLLQANRLDGALDWHEFSGSPAIDYGGDQRKVLASIAVAVDSTAESRAFQEQLSAKMLAHCRSIATKQTGAASQLIDDFGSGGAAQAAQLILNRARKAISHA